MTISILGRTHLLVKGKRPNSVTYLNWAPIHEWCVVKCASKEGHHIDIVFRRDWKRIFTLTINKAFMSSPSILRKVTGYANHLMLITCFIYEK